VTNNYISIFQLQWYKSPRYTAADTWGWSGVAVAYWFQSTKLTYVGAG